MIEKKKKICFAASSGGHFEQLLMLKSLMKEYDSFVVTEQTKYNTTVSGERMYYLHQINRKDKLVVFEMLINIWKSLLIYLKETPDVIICTGVLAMIPLCIICKLNKKKLIYIESFAKVSTGTKSGKFLYRFADRFYVQWPQMLKVYPNAVCVGGIY